MVSLLSFYFRICVFIARVRRFMVVVCGRASYLLALVQTNGELRFQLAISTETKDDSTYAALLRNFLGHLDGVVCCVAKMFVVADCSSLKSRCGSKSQDVRALR